MPKLAFVLAFLTELFHLAAQFPKQLKDGRHTQAIHEMKIQDRCKSTKDCKKLGEYYHCIGKESIGYSCKISVVNRHCKTDKDCHEMGPTQRCIFETELDGEWGQSHLGLYCRLLSPNDLMKHDKESKEIDAKGMVRCRSRAECMMQGEDYHCLEAVKFQYQNYHFGGYFCEEILPDHACNNDVDCNKFRSRHECLEQQSAANHTYQIPIKHCSTAKSN